MEVFHDMTHESQEPRRKRGCEAGEWGPVVSMSAFAIDLLMRFYSMWRNYGVLCVSSLSSGFGDYYVVLCITLKNNPSVIN